MREETGDIFDYPADAIVIPTNWSTKRNGDAVMGAGVAKQAAERWPWIATRLGYIIATEGEPSVRGFVDDGLWIVAFPTKRDWHKPADPVLIERLLLSLLRLAERYRWREIALPRLGCGLGGLQWSDVRPILARHLDDRFVVLTPADHSYHRTAGAAPQISAAPTSPHDGSPRPRATDGEG